MLPLFSNLILHHSNLPYHLSIKHSSVNSYCVVLKNNDIQSDIATFPFFREHVSSNIRRFPRGNLLARKSRVKSNRIRSHWIQTVRNFSREQAVKICPRTRASCMPRYRGHMALIFLFYCRHVGNEGESKGGGNIAFFFLASNRRIFATSFHQSTNIHHVISPRMFPGITNP